MEIKMLIQILSYISLKRVILIPKIFLKPDTQFGQARKAGYIRIQKRDGQFYASLHQKGVVFLINHEANKLN